jgi:hypothetical protein
LFQMQQRAHVLRKKEAKYDKKHVNDDPCPNYPAEPLRPNIHDLNLVF